MSKLLSVALILALASLNASAADGPATDPSRMTIATIEPLVRDYAHQANPKLVKPVKFRIEECDVDGLWKTLKIQLFLVHYLSDEGTQFNVASVMYHDGKLTCFVNAWGGDGPMSGTMIGKTLYYTYSWGSGEHRSHVGILKIEGGKVKTIETKPYFEADLFVKNIRGNIKVESGEFKAFNSWNNGTAFGALEEQGAELKIVNAKGEEVPSNVSRNPK